MGLTFMARKVPNQKPQWTLWPTLEYSRPSSGSKNCKIFDKIAQGSFQCDDATDLAFDWANEKSFKWNIYGPFVGENEAGNRSRNGNQVNVKNVLLKPSLAIRPMQQKIII